VRKFASQRLQRHEKVNAYFQLHATYWKEIYASSGLNGEIYRNRHDAVLDWVDSLNLPAGASVLEIGCGAGLMSLALAQRGFRVYAIDSVETMVEQARKLACESECAGMLTVDVDDVYALTFEDESFDLVIAIGVIPWLDRVDLAMRQMARVTRPAGHVILTADNRARLTNFLDPWLNPALGPLKRGMSYLLDRVGLRRRSPSDIGATYHAHRFIDETMARVRFMKKRSVTLGFGPFTLFRHPVLPEPLGIRLHHRLQFLADRKVPVLRCSGAHYIVLASKSVCWPLTVAKSAEKSVSDATHSKWRFNDERYD
jgi:2-polyprenyl-3-methyl-5-hydroxy-6-metoxy-1,4-benzoquinol methylase